MAPGGFRERLGGLLRGSSATERVQDRPWDPPGPPKQTLEARPRPQERPNGANRASGPPPRGGQKCSKMQQGILRPSLLGPRGAPRAAGEASGSNFAMISDLPSLCFSNVRAFLSGVRKEQKQRRHSQRESELTQQDGQGGSFRRGFPLTSPWGAAGRR